MSPLDSLTPAQYRSRYDALLADARARAGAPAAIPPPGPIAEADVIQHETIPGSWYGTVHVRRGEVLRLVNPHGATGVSALFWNAADPSERYSAADTIKVQWTTRLRAGLLLLSDMGRVMLSIVADSDGWHDTVLGSGMRAAPGPDGPRDARDNFLLAAAKHGLTARDVGASIAFFAGVRTTAADGFAWEPAASRPGAIVDLRAEMDVLVALSNWPHPLSPALGQTPPPVEAIVWKAPPAPPDDPCRNAGPEARRAFENTDRLYR